MDKPSIGVVGMGFVGSAVFRGFKDYAHVKGYDIEPRLATHTLEETCRSKFVFLCLPTPMPRADGGAAVLTTVEEVCARITDLIYPETTVVLKSTVPIGTSRRLAEEYRLPDLVHNPEFLTEANANLDFITPARIVLGGVQGSVFRVGGLYAQRFPRTPIYGMLWEESEAVKYVANCFLAVKVAFFNEVKQGLASRRLEWGKVMAAVLADGRIGRTHYQVPGPDGKLGFGGSCFPKDLSALIEQIRETGDLEPLLLEAAWTQNKLLRPEMDWWSDTNE